MFTVPDAAGLTEDSVSAFLHWGFVTHRELTPMALGVVEGSRTLPHPRARQPFMEAYGTLGRLRKTTLALATGALERVEDGEQPPAPGPWSRHAHTTQGGGGFGGPGGYAPTPFGPPDRRYPNDHDGGRGPYPSLLAWFEAHVYATVPRKMADLTRRWEQLAAEWSAPATEEFDEVRSALTVRANRLDRLGVNVPTTSRTRVPVPLRAPQPPPNRQCRPVAAASGPVLQEEAECLAPY